ncbi:MAG: chemotaxis-specific protein-glutamate methyltransferase CheB [Halodesulfurarchaeum sp.]
MTRAVVVDDSHFMRTVLADILEDGGIDVVATGADGREAVELVSQHEPDVVTMDVEMPEMDGIEATAEIMRRDPVPILMVSAVTTDGADATLEALERGAIDVFAKPGGSISTKLSGQKDQLVRAVERVARADPAAALQTSPKASVSTTETETRTGSSGGTVSHSTAAAPEATPATDTAEASYLDNPTLVIGASTGGPNLVERLLATLPVEADLRILVVQHMPDQFTERFAKRLDQQSAYSIREAEERSRVGGGEGLVARGDYHMRVSGYGNGRLRVKLDQSEPVHSVRPAIDVTMRTAAEHVTDPLTGVVLTGMGADGAEGIRAVKEADGRTIAQDEDSAAVFGIPKKAIETGAVDRVLPAGDIAEGILESFRSDTTWTTT